MIRLSTFIAIHQNQNQFMRMTYSRLSYFAVFKTESFKRMKPEQNWSWVISNRLKHWTQILRKINKSLIKIWFRLYLLLWRKEYFSCRADLCSSNCFQNVSILRTPLIVVYLSFFYSNLWKLTRLLREKEITPANHFHLFCLLWIKRAALLF